MALQNTRQIMALEDGPLGGVPFDGGLMSLPGANTTVANQNVVQDIVNQATANSAAATQNANQATTQALSQDLPGQLFGFDTTGFRSGTKLEDVYDQFLKRKADTGGLEYWKKEIGPTVEADELTKFLEAAAPERQRVSALKSPDVVDVKDLYEQALGRTNVSPQELAFWSKEFGHSISPVEVERFLASAQPELGTSKYTPFSQTVDTTAYPKFEGTSYNPRAYEKIVNQLTEQQKAIEQETGFKYGSTFGGAQETIDDLAKRMASMGLTSIYDLGMKHELPVEKVYQTIEQDEGAPLQIDTGKYRTISKFKGYDAENNPIFEYRELTPNEVESLKFDKSGMGFLPIGRGTQEELMNTPYATTKYYNKKTGEEIDTRKFGSKAESGLFASSGAGEGYTNYRVMYNKEGIPIFVPEKELSGMKEFVAKDLPGILSVLSFIPGAQPFVTAAQLAGGLAAGMDPGQLLKSVGTSLLASNIGKIGNTYLPQMGFDLPTSTLGKAALNAGYSGLASLIRGGDLDNALKSGILSLAGSGVKELMPTVQPGEFDYGKILMSLAPALADGKLSNADIFQLVNMLAKDEAKKSKTPGKP